MGSIQALGCLIAQVKDHITQQLAGARHNTVVHTVWAPASITRLSISVSDTHVVSGIPRSYDLVCSGQWSLKGQESLVHGEHGFSRDSFPQLLALQLY